MKSSNLNRTLEVPSRKRLGVDRGLTGRDISLKRSPLTTSSESRLETQSSSAPDNRPTLSRRTSSSIITFSASQSSANIFSKSRPDRPTSQAPNFFERFVASRKVDRAHNEEIARVKKERIRGFNISLTKDRAAKLPKRKADDQANSEKQPKIEDAHEVPKENQPTKESTVNNGQVDGPDLEDDFEIDKTGKEQNSTPKTANRDGRLYERYSRLNLASRYISEEDVDTHFESKKIFTVTSIFAEVQPPEFNPPVYPNWVVVGIISSKSPIKETKGRVGKYFIITLTDLKQEIDVFILGKAFDKLWKMRIGDVVAVLNPGIYTGKPSDSKITTGFSLNLTESDDVVLELGRSQDLAMCAALTKKDRACTNWVDKRITKYCEYHIEQVIKKGMRGRAEVNKGTGMHSPKRKDGRKLHFVKGPNGLKADPRAPKLDGWGGGGGNVYVVPTFMDA